MRVVVAILAAVLCSAVVAVGGSDPSSATQIDSSRVGRLTTSRKLLSSSSSKSKSKSSSSSSSSSSKKDDKKKPPSSSSSSSSKKYKTDAKKKSAPPPDETPAPEPAPDEAPIVVVETSAAGGAGETTEAVTRPPQPNAAAEEEQATPPAEAEAEGGLASLFAPTTWSVSKQIEVLNHDLTTKSSHQTPTPWRLSRVVAKLNDVMVDDMNKTKEKEKAQAPGGLTRLMTEKAEPAETFPVRDMLSEVYAKQERKESNKQLAGAGVAPGGLTALMWHSHPDLAPETAGTHAPTATPISPVIKQLRKVKEEMDPDAAFKMEAKEWQQVREGKSLAGLMKLNPRVAPPPPQSIDQVLVLAKAQAQAQAQAAMETQEVIERLMQMV